MKLRTVTFAFVSVANVSIRVLFTARLSNVALQVRDDVVPTNEMVPGTYEAPELMLVMAKFLKCQVPPVRESMTLPAMAAFPVLIITSSTDTGTTENPLGQVINWPQLWDWTLLMVVCAPGSIQKSL